MSLKSFTLRPLAIAALLLAAGAAQAALTVYTSAASFATATTAPGVDTYTGFSLAAVTPSPVTRTAGSYTYTASAPSGLFGAGFAADPWLSTVVYNQAITFSGFSPSIQALGGLFFDNNINGWYQQGDVSLTATDSLGASSTQTITGATSSSFLGFVSTGSIVSLSVISVQGANGQLWPTVDNLTLALRAAAPVPEPGTYALLIAGLGFVGFLAHRRQV